MLFQRQKSSIKQTERTCVEMPPRKQISPEVPPLTINLRKCDTFQYRKIFLHQNQQNY